MNRFAKKNIVLIGILAGSVILALALLVYAVIAVVNVNSYLSRTAKARDTIQKLVKQKPAPGEENEKRLQQDIELYKKSLQGMLARFKSPLQPAVDAFIAELPPPLLSGEDAEAYKVPGTGETDEEGKVTKPLKIKKLTQSEFKTLLKSKFDQYTADMNEQDKIDINTQNSFIDDFSRLFSARDNKAASWDSAVQIFVNKARLLTLEPIDPSNQIALLLSALGFPRRVHASGTRFMEHMSQFSVVLSNAAGATDLAPQASDFLISVNTGSTSLQSTEFAQVLFHWDIFGDIVKRLSAAKIKQISKIYVRKYAAGEGQGQTLGTLFEQLGSYKIYHYTIEVYGSMESFRKAVKELDEAFKDNRVYIVRSVYLYEDGDSAAALMGRNQVLTTQQNNTSEVNDDAPVMRRRRRGRRQEAVSVRAEENTEEKNKKDERARILAAEAKLPINERSGYGAILLGGKEDFHAFIDIDYVVLDQEQ